jgi:carboxyl-terminal processing protease
MRATSVSLVGLAAGAMLTLLAAGPRFVLDGHTAQTTVPAQADEGLDRLRSVVSAVENSYVEKPDTSKLTRWAIEGMLRALDPHSQYLDDQAFRDLEEEARGVFGGLSIEVAAKDGLVAVVAPAADSSAARAGLKPGDIITAVDNVPVRGLTITQVVERIRGPQGSTILLQIKRQGQDRPIDLKVIREVVRVRSVRSRIEANSVGYIYITKFNGLTFDGLQAAISDLSSKIPRRNLKGYILDLRNNPGGVLDQSILVAGAFLSGGTEIVSTHGRSPHDVQHFATTANSHDLTEGKPIVVLVNGGSASAAEIVAGALQDHRRATIVGTRTFGKGSVQTATSLGPGKGGIQLTTAWYFTPAGRSIQATGILPDIEVMQDVPKDAAPSSITSEAALLGHLKAKDEERTGSQSYIPPNPNNDKALNTAVELLRGAKDPAAILPGMRN